MARAATAASSRQLVRGAVLALVAGWALPPAVPASDHADPVSLARLEGGITDLFIFPARDFLRRVEDSGLKDAAQDGRPKTYRAVRNGEANRLVVVLCVRRSLSTSPPYEGLDQFTYRIHADLHSEVIFKKDDPNLARYGGTVKTPEGIGADFTIEIALNNDTNIRERKVQVKQGDTWKTKEDGELIRWHWYTGVRDDPFIFPQFFGTNVVAMVISIPLESFPAGQTDFLFWATSERRGARVDHVGRSQRTQLPRFDFLNTIHPKDHVAALRMREQDPGLKDDFLRVRIPTEFNLRPYDFQPDVMYFTRRPEFDAEYPNGRQLEDDVADLTCKQGDCQLFELSQSHPRFQGGQGRSEENNRQETGTRPTRNDKEFSDTFPYLADPHPNSDPRNPPGLTTKNQFLVAGLIVLIGGFVLLPWFLIPLMGGSNREFHASARSAYRRTGRPGVWA
jgi:hypothetical protein